MINKPHLALDGYKTGHKFQYPEGTTLVYSNLTARSSTHARMPASYDGKVVIFGLQAVVQEFLIDSWNEGFFKRDKAVVVAEYKRRMDTYLGEGAVDVSHIEALHNLGYLPICIKAVKEGMRVNIKVPFLTLYNTLPEFFWLTNYVETVLSAELWKQSTVATLAYEYRRILNKYVEATGSSKEFADWQLHDFSFRGMSNLQDATKCGAAHLVSAGYGTDTLPAIDYLEHYYFADASKELVAGSVPATEHSVMCMGGVDDEIGTFKRLITETYPTGVVSIVSDTWDFWNVITNTATELKDDIILRKPNALGLAKVVFRPDSGDPVKIICGDDSEPGGTPAHKGAVQCLWDIFGGDYTNKGYKTLNQRVGLIYGDSITLERAEEILKQLEAKGFSAGNVVFGIGSYTYQYITRDTFGMAMKATFGVVNGEDREIFKDPKTGDGVKKSAKGLLRVENEGGEFVLYDQQTCEQENEGALEVVFEDGKLKREQSLQDIRSMLKQ